MQADEIDLQPMRRSNWARLYRNPAVPVGALLLLVLFCTAAIVPAVTAGASNPPAAFFVVQLADPQFGLEHSNARWTAEQEMLNRSIMTVNRLAPRFVVATGDLQNWLPTAAGSGWPMPVVHGHPGADQVASVKQSLTLLDRAIPLRACIPGNHDLGYAPTIDTLERYVDLWGADKYSFEEGGVMFIALNSQLYYNATQPGVGKRAHRQTAWLSRQLDAAAAASGVAGVVVLSHIPPFVVAGDEAAGWANWPTATRQHVLSMTQSKPLPPSLFISGHFHANVEHAYTSHYGSTVESVTTSSVGCPIFWNGSDSSPLPLASAKAIATEPSGHDAFDHYVLRNGRASGPADANRIGQRIQARPDRSGVRVFEFDSSRGYRHRWFTLEQLDTLRTPLATGAASPLASMPFTLWSKRRA